MFGKAIALAGFAAFVPFVLDRIPAITPMINNAPSKLETKTPHRYVYPLKEELKNCEDAIMDIKTGYGILSCDPGRDTWNPIMGVNIDSKGPKGQLVRYRYRTRDMADYQFIDIKDYPDNGGEFHPLGIEYHEESKTIWIVNNLSSGPQIDIFTADIENEEHPTATYQRTLQHPLLNRPNSIAAINEHEFYITNCQYFDNRYLKQFELYTAVPLASVIYVNTLLDEYRVVARVPFANGIVILEDKTVVVASSTKPGLYLFDRNTTSHDLSHRRTIRTKHHVDNLSVDDQGNVLLAGHPHLPTLEKAIKCRAGSDDPTCATTKAASWIQEWTEKGGFKDIYVGDEFESATTALRQKGFGRGFATGLYGHGILLWGEQD